MIRVRIQLRPDQHERLEALAVRRSRTFSQLVREGVDCLLAAERSETAWDRFLAAAGSCRAADDATDVSVHHDAYLSDAIRVKSHPVPQPEAIAGRREAPAES